MAEIDARRSEVLGRSSTIIQAKFLAHSAHKKFILLQCSAIPIQALCRGQVARLCYEHRRREVSCLRIQKNARMYLDRKTYRFLRCSAIEIQNGMRGMAAHNEYTYRQQTKAAIIIQSHCRQDLACLHYLRTRKAAIVAQSLFRGNLARRELRKLKMAAKETGVLQEAKSKLEKEIEELTMRLQLEEHMRADMEEAKNKENAKLQSALKEMEVQLADMEEAKNKENAKLQSALKEMEVQLADMEEAKNKENAKLQSALKEMEVQFQETKELLMKELEVAKKEIEQGWVDNEKLKDMVKSLEQEVNETRMRYEETIKLSEERLTQAMDVAESKIIELKISMQSLQEKISDMEAEDQILRQQGRQSATPLKRFDSNLTQSTIGKEREMVDALMKAAAQDLGLCQGKPVATYVIYKSLLHWKSFEAERTSVFDRIVQAMGSEIGKKEDNKHMAYWLSITSTLLFWIQKSLSPSLPKTEQPTSLFGRMTQGFRSSPSSSNLGIVRHVEAKYPALLFKKQLAAYVEKIYGIICNNLKKDLSPLLSSCIQAPTSNSNSHPTTYWESIIETYWESIIECLSGMLSTLKEYHVPLVITQKIFAQVFSYIDVKLFNSVLLRKECCTFRNGEFVKAGLTKLELWCSQDTAEYADSSWDELKHVRQAAEFLVIHQKSKMSYDELTTHLCPVLSVQQLYRVCTLYSDDNENTLSVAPEVISNFKVLMTEDSNDPDGNSFLLDDNSSIPFSVDEIGKSLDERFFSDFTDVKPTGELLENPEFQFLLE